MRPGLLALRAVGAAAVVVAVPVLVTGAGGAVQDHDSVRGTLTPSAVTLGGVAGPGAGHCTGGTATAHGSCPGQHRPGDLPTPFGPVQIGSGGPGADGPAADGPGSAARPEHPAAADEVRDESAGPGAPQAVVGLVLAGVAAVAVAFRGARRRRNARDPDLEPDASHDRRP
ncbi:hypothetical protein KQY30_23165 [Streptomyces sp. GMY02]|uniref:hypothetical protein n=1 Tax=Streptomyces sp. GMY02 TaxID=1333528 RepID=UPI001C2C1233|nr:hypothetical protein [Streptomyces sp. GMY02]QXE39643.1 hypothetical protein KQY30_23165 [Streptomyces sp. GMY02]